MSFDVLKNRIGGGGSEKVSLTQNSRQFTIGLGSGLVADLGWKKGTTIEMLLGSDADFGKLRVINVAGTAANYTAQRMSPQSGTLRICRFGLPGVPRITRAREYVEFVRIRNGIEIVLPSWARPATAKPAVVDVGPSGLNRDIIRPIGFGIMAQPVRRRCTACSALFKTNDPRQTTCNEHPHLAEVVNG